MEKIAGIEGFMREFLEWYRPFLREIERFGIEKPGTEAFESKEEEEIDLEKIFFEPFRIERYASERVTRARGTLDELLEKERELELKIAQLSSSHSIVVKPIYTPILAGRHVEGTLDPIPHYDLFLNGFEFLVGDDQKLLLEIDYSKLTTDFLPRYDANNQLYLYFEPDVQVPGEYEEGNEFYKYQTHPVIGRSARLFYHIRDLDGNFICGEEGHIKFDVGRTYGKGHKAIYPLKQRVHINLDNLPNGGFTAFLEMLKEKPRE